MHKTQKWFQICFILLLGLFLCACEGQISSADTDTWAPTLANCWVCSIYGTVFSVANNVVYDSVNQLMPTVQVIFGFGLLFFLLYQVGRIMVFVPTKEMIGQMKETGFVLVKALMVGVLILNGDNFLWFFKEAFLYPVGQFFMMMSNAVLDAVPASGEYFSGVEGLTPDTKQVWIAEGVPVNFTGKIDIFGDLGIQVQYTLSRIFSSLRTGLTLVLHLMTRSSFTGWCVALVALYQVVGLMIVFPLIFIDAFVMMAFYTIWLPFCLVMWIFPFKSTKKFLKAIMPGQFISGFMDLLFGCIVVVLMVTMLQVFSDLVLGNILNETAQEASDALITSAAAGRPNIIILMMLLVAVKKMAYEVSDFSSFFGGVNGRSAVLVVMQRAQKLLKAAAKGAVAYATGNAAVAKEAISDATDVAKEAASDMMGADMEAVGGFGAPSFGKFGNDGAQNNASGEASGGGKA